MRRPNHLMHSHSAGGAGANTNFATGEVVHPNGAKVLKLPKNRTILGKIHTHTHTCRSSCVLELACGAGFCLVGLIWLRFSGQNTDVLMSLRILSGHQRAGWNSRHPASAHSSQADPVASPPAIQPSHERWRLRSVVGYCGRFCTSNLSLVFGL